MKENIFIPEYPLKTPVLFIVFKRIDTTKEVFNAIRSAKVPKLYIAGDGARDNVEDEFEKVKEVRDFLLKNIDWDCEVRTLFSEKNQGCMLGEVNAMNWFFENEEQGIILEDDCIPSQSFFWYCEELLERYKNDDSIYLISGDSRGSEHINMKADYGFCKYPMVWGWASWSRVWKKYDSKIEDWPENKKNLIASVSKNKSTRRFWCDTFQKMYENKIDTWDYQFVYLLLKNNARCIVPRQNLIKNIGFGSEATHTFDASSACSNRMTYEYEFPLNHTIDVKSEELINSYYDHTEFMKKNLLLRIFNKLSRTILNKNI